MFQSLTPNQTLYILNKSGVPTIDKGLVQNVSPIKTIPSAQFGQMPTQVVDVTVLVNGQTVTYTLPAMGVVGTLQGNGSLVVAMNREAMSNEVLNVKQRSVDHINSNEFHQNVIARCDELWSELNPEAKEKETMQNEVNTLKDQMSVMATNMAQLMEMNKQLMSKLDSERNSKKNKEQ